MHAIKNFIFLLRPILAVVAIAALWTFAVGQSATRDRSATSTGRNAASPMPNEARAGVDKSFTLLREGTRLRESRGHFEPTGDSAIFITANGARLGGLNNLNLQRVVQTLNARRDAERLEWTVSGEVTEFRGRNYLLITRVVRRSAVAEPAERGTGGRTRNDRLN